MRVNLVNRHDLGWLFNVPRWKFQELLYKLSPSHNRLLLDSTCSLCSSLKILHATSKYQMGEVLSHMHLKTIATIERTCYNRVMSLLFPAIPCWRVGAIRLRGATFCRRQFVMTQSFPSSARCASRSLVVRSSSIKPRQSDLHHTCVQ